MSNIATSLRTKILLLAILPLTLVTVVVTMISMNQARHLSEQEIQTFEENLLSSKRNELMNYVDMAMNAIAPVVANAEPGDAAAEAELKRILNNLNYGDDGYFFMYTAEGVNLVHPVQPELVGLNLYDLQDRDGRYVIRNLLRLASEGGGFFRYLWEKPSRGDLEDKLSYVVLIPKFNWMMGTGLYIDDIAKEVASIRLKVTQNIRNTFFTVLAILAATLVVIALIGVAINIHATQLADKSLRDMAHRYVQFQVAQRRNFARELHDGINQLMVSVKFRIELALEKLQGGQDSATQDLETAHRVLDQTIQEVRRLSHDLRPMLLDDLGLESALQSMLNDFSLRTHIAPRVKLVLPDTRLPDDIEITLYRMAQEALTNIERHSGATDVSLTIWPEDGEVWLEIKDNGQGFSSAAASGDGIGLLNMRERTELLSGVFHLQSKPGQGTTLRAGFSVL
ncbi:cache domain-containing protein [Pontibacter sp. JAM-7]|uniref:cache domain-containing protein n=1 Tax=Pontibacter sp. JAM-7 TaxID=3366581 RepID=UPI003AF46A0E